MPRTRRHPDLRIPHVACPYGNPHCPNPGKPLGYGYHGACVALAGSRPELEQTDYKRTLRESLEDFTRAMRERKPKRRIRWASKEKLRAEIEDLGEKLERAYVQRDSLRAERDAWRDFGNEVGRTLDSLLARLPNARD